MHPLCRGSWHNRGWYLAALPVPASAMGIAFVSANSRGVCGVPGVLENKAGCVQGQNPLLLLNMVYIPLHHFERENK